jgi:hypothetical protein
MKGLVIVAALLVGGTSLAVAQSGPATGGYPPVAGGAAGNPATNPGFMSYTTPSGKNVQLRITKVHGRKHVLVPMEMSCDVFRVGC